MAHSGRVGRVGTFTYRYRGTAPDGASTTIGLENADGTDAFQYSYNAPALTEDWA